MKEIVIKIPDELYDDVIEDGVLYIDYEPVLRDAIKNAVVIPKNHGRLIDADELIEGKVANDWTRIQAECANTIIEAESEDKNV